MDNYSRFRTEVPSEEQETCPSPGSHVEYFHLRISVEGEGGESGGGKEMQVLSLVTERLHWPSTWPTVARWGLNSLRGVRSEVGMAWDWSLTRGQCYEVL